VDFIHSNCLPFSLVEDQKFLKIIKVARTVGHYKPQTCKLIGRKYLHAIHNINWKEQMRTLVSEANIFRITLFGDGALIKTVPLLNILAAGVKNPFALIHVEDCTNHLARGGMKDASHIANVITPLIENLEAEIDEHKLKCTSKLTLSFLMVQVTFKMLESYCE
jgi:hypothetical protein